jgi:hypothetical protein
MRLVSDRVCLVKYDSELTPGLANRIAKCPLGYGARTRL